MVCDAALVAMSNCNVKKVMSNGYDSLLVVFAEVHESYETVEYSERLA